MSGSRETIFAMEATPIKFGLTALGYGEEDVQALVDGALRQQRLLLLAPREPDAEDLAQILRDSMANW